jgi:uncharacterized damage-inducible protein DinB
MTDKELRAHIDAIERGPSMVVAAAAGADESALRFKPAPDKWCILEILGHLADVEVIYGYRLRQMIADKQPTIAPIDQDDWARHLGYLEAKPAELLEAYQAARRANVRLLRRLQPADLDSKSAFHPEKKRQVTLSELLGMMAIHDPNHAGQIERLKKESRSGRS